jgi:hypothetical protein
MLAMNYRGPQRVRIDHKPMPEIVHPQDAIVRVTRSCICGSDLHLYEVLGAFMSFVLGGVYSLVLLMTRRAGRRTAIPFGPFMLLGTLVTIVWGSGLLDAYLGS